MSVMIAIEDALNNIDRAVGRLPHVSAAKIGLDPRAGYVYVDIDEQLIISEGSHGSLDYYGGFEYVPDGNITEIGPYKIYAAEGEEYCERIVDALDSYEELMDEEVA